MDVASELLFVPAVLFLDVDGVLHSVVAGDRIQSAADLQDVLTAWENLEPIVGEVGPAVVLSSTWRHSSPDATPHLGA